MAFPLCPDCVLHVSVSAQSLFIACDPFWMQVLFEHVLLNTISALYSVFAVLPARFLNLTSLYRIMWLYHNPLSFRICWSRCFQD